MLNDFDFITSTEYPETAEYIEKMIPPAVDEPVTYAGAIKFKFRVKSDSQGNMYVVPGLRTSKRIDYEIETKSPLSFKPGDIIRFESNDLARYTINQVNYGVDNRNEEEYQFINQDFPGLANRQIKFKIISLS